VNPSTQITLRKDYRVTISGIAKDLLAGTLPAGEVAMAASTCATAFAASRSAARDPKDFDACLESPEGLASVGRCIVQAAQTRLYPGGVSPLAYLIPQSPRKGEPKQLRFALSHRGACLLAADEGWAVVPVPVAVTDSVSIEFGEVTAHIPQGPQPSTLEDLAGVYVTLRKDGRLISRPWLSRSDIVARMERSPTAGASHSPWKSDPIPMAQKTAIHYCVARGMMPIRSAVARDAIGSGEAEDVPTPRLQPGQRVTVEQVPDPPADPGNDIKGTSSSPATMNRQAGDDGEGA